MHLREVTWMLRVWVVGIERNSLLGRIVVRWRKIIWHWRIVIVGRCSIDVLMYISGIIWWWSLMGLRGWFVACIVCWGLQLERSRGFSLNRNCNFLRTASWRASYWYRMTYWSGRRIESHSSLASSAERNSPPFESILLNSRK